MSSEKSQRKTNTVISLTCGITKALNFITVIPLRCGIKKALNFIMEIVKISGCQKPWVGAWVK